MTPFDARKSVVDAVGVRAIHAIEDGVTVGALLALTLTYRPLAALVAGGLGLAPGRAGPLVVAKDLTDIVRQDDARTQESYFVVATLVGFVVATPLGLLARATVGPLGPLI